MKIKLTFKTPDVLDCALEDVDEELKSEVQVACEKWVKYGEYVRIEIDTCTGEAKVLPA